jgi:hypothetical protein
MNASSPSPLFPNKKRETGAHPVSLEKLFIFILTSSINWMEKDFPFSCYIIKTLHRLWQEEFFFSKSLFMLLSLTLIELHFLHVLISNRRHNNVAVFALNNIY